MIRSAILITLIITLPVPIGTATEDKVADVRIELRTESPVWVGQTVSFDIELMSSTLFAGTAHFELPTIPGAFLMKVPGSPVVGSETIDGETWSIQRHGFRFYPHRAGESEIPTIPVRFSVAPAGGKPPELQRFETTAISVEAKMPSGAETQSLLISTNGLAVKQTWSPVAPQEEKMQLSVGDAFTRKIELVAEDVPGMALPAITFPKNSGMSLYQNDPVIDDKNNRGDLTGKRTDSATYVCERVGDFEMPALVITWWDIKREVLKRETLSSVTVTVNAAPPPVDNAIDAGEGSSNSPSAIGEFGKLVFAIVGLVTGMTWFGWRYFRRPIETMILDLKQRRAKSEAAVFKTVKRACLQNDAVSTLNCLMKWLQVQSDGSKVATIQSFLDRNPDNPEIADELSKLQLAVMEGSGGWTGNKLFDELVQIRGKSKTSRWHDRKPVLPQLNPTRSK